LERKAASGIMLLLLSIGMFTLVFNIQTGKATETIYVRADGSIEPPNAPISSIDNITYTFTSNIYDSIVVERDNIVIDGAGYTIHGAGGVEGIDLTGRSNVTIENMGIEAFTWGILLSVWSSNNTISGNHIADNYEGIHLYQSSSNSISGNIVTANEDGIYLFNSSNNIIYGNNITANNCAGIEFYSSSNNIIYNNSFVDNTKQVYSYDSTNVWDNGYPSGGNYWSDYTGDDLLGGSYQNETGSDGIGDASYVIDENNQDYFPLISLWGLEEVPDEEIPPPPPFWMQWWFYAIVAAIIVALAGTVYFLKKRKPPTPTAPTLPTKGT